MTARDVIAQALVLSEAATEVRPARRGKANNAPCASPACDQRAWGRGLCQKHYNRWRRHGSIKATTEADRFWRKVSEDPAGCWVWGGYRDPDKGYGQFTTSSRTQALAHRWAYEHLVTEIPAGLHLDHLCRNTSCVNPWHLEPVTARVNVQRSWAARKEVTP